MSRACAGGRQDSQGTNGRLRYPCRRAVHQRRLCVPVAGWLWLVAGGLAYTAGIAFYAAERVRYGHFVWHVFVLMGTACHFFAVLWYAT